MIVLDLRQLAALRAVAEHRSVARAARALAWSQPTVSHHLRALEAAIGSPVVASSPTGTRLTPAGTLLLPHARAILDRSERALEEARTLVAERRTAISFGIFPSAGARLLPSVVRSLRRSGYSVRVHEAELRTLLGELEAMRLDAAVIYSDPERRVEFPAHVHARALFTEEFSLVVPEGHPLADRAEVELGAFAHEEWILGVADDDPCDVALFAAAATLGFAPREAIRSDDYAVVTGYVAAGFGVALVPQLALPDRLDGVRVLRLRNAGLVREILLVTSEYLDESIASVLAGSVAEWASAAVVPISRRD